jgi:hypothetical protein
MPAKKGRESHGFANRARAGTRNFPGYTKKYTPQKILTVNASTAGPSAVLQPGRLFVVWA